MVEVKFNDILIMKNLTRYFKSKKAKKNEILSVIEANTGLNRKSIIRRLNTLKKKVPKPRGGSKSKYLPEIKIVLEKVWEARDYICAELLHGYISKTIDILIRNGDLDGINPLAITQVKGIPLGTLKLKLRSLGIVKKQRYYARSGKDNLKQNVAVSTSMNTVKVSGWLELDFVDHSGGDASGIFCRTLCATDVFNSFTARRCALGKTEDTVQKIFQEAINLFPFKLSHLHTDNEKTLLKSLLKQQAVRNNISISRSRSYQKQDNGHVEQKNRDKIRNLVGFRRYDSNYHLELLNQIYQIDDLFQNHFIPSQKLLEKIYDENHKLIKKIYDQPKTPYERILSDNTVGKKEKLALISFNKRLNPIKLKEDRDLLLRKLKTISVTY